jgi:hypothetical protein
MTQGLEQFFNLPPLDDVLKSKGIDVHATEATEPTDENVQQSLASLKDLSAKMAMMEGADHSEAMDELYKEIVQHARDLMTYGYNIDMPRQRGIFEIAAAMYGHAISTKNSKRDAQLKALRLSLDRRKTDLEEKRTNHAIGEQAATIEGNTIVVEDRNELINRIRNQVKNQKAQA